MMIRFFLALAAVFLFLPGVHADTIKLKSGKVVQGKIVERNERTVQLDVGLDFPITYYPDEILEIIENKDAPADAAALPPVKKTTASIAGPNVSKADDLDQQGLALIYKGQMEDGLALVRQAAVLSPQGNRHLNLGSILVGNGVSLQKRGQTEEAVKLFHEAQAEIKQALKMLDPQSETTLVSEAYNLLGEICANGLNDKIQAKKYYEQSLSFFENPAARRGLDSLQ